MTGSPHRPVTYDGFAGLSWMSVSELAWLIDRLPPHGLFLEVGSASGVSAARIADARPGLSILCLDTFVDLDKPHVAEAEPSRPANWRANRRPNMTLFVGTLADLVRLGPSVRADAILVDADHEEHGAFSDLLLASTCLLSPVGTLYVHDCDEPGHPGVNAAVDRFCGDHRFTAIGQHWTLRALSRI